MGEFITSKQAEELFAQNGLSRSTFRRRVYEGKIDRVVSENRQRGALYPRAQVLAAIRGEVRNIVPACAMQATVEDMPFMADVIEALFGSYPDVPRWQGWMIANPKSGFIVRTKENIVGCGFLLPLYEGYIKALLAQEVTPPTRGSDVLSYEPGQHYCLYARSIGVYQEKENRRYWAAMLLRHMVEFVIDLGNHGIIIDKIYGRSDTLAGERCMRSLGMTQIATTTSHKNFMIDVGTSGLAWAVKYKRNLGRWLEYKGE
jgi:hypothetical protein